MSRYSPPECRQPRRSESSPPRHDPAAPSSLRCRPGSSGIPAKQNPRAVGPATCRPQGPFRYLQWVLHNSFYGTAGNAARCPLTPLPVPPAAEGSAPLPQTCGTLLPPRSTQATATSGTTHPRRQRNATNDISKLSVSPAIASVFASWNPVPGLPTARRSCTVPAQISNIVPASQTMIVS